MTCNRAAPISSHQKRNVSTFSDAEFVPSVSMLSLIGNCVLRLTDVVVVNEAEPAGLPGPRIVFVNDAFELQTGYSRDEVIGKTPRILQGPLTEQVELRRIGEALRAWEPVRAELINYTKSGDTFHVEMDIVPIADERDGSRIGSQFNGT
jgi:PAS domain S-box-containing protein